MQTFHAGPGERKGAHTFANSRCAGVARCSDFGSTLCQVFCVLGQSRKSGVYLRSLRLTFSVCYGCPVVIYALSCNPEMTRHFRWRDRHGLCGRQSGIGALMRVLWSKCRRTASVCREEEAKPRSICGFCRSIASGVTRQRRRVGPDLELVPLILSRVRVKVVGAWRFRIRPRASGVAVGGSGALGRAGRASKTSWGVRDCGWQCIVCNIVGWIESQGTGVNSRRSCGCTARGMVIGMEAGVMSTVAPSTRDARTNGLRKGGDLVRIGDTAEALAATIWSLKTKIYLAKMARAFGQLRSDHCIWDVEGCVGAEGGMGKMGVGGGLHEAAGIMLGRQQRKIADEVSGLD